MGLPVRCCDQQLQDIAQRSVKAECGSMAKAASELGVTQPAVSEVVAGLEQAFGVRLFDRSPRGVEPTIYGRALLNRGIAAFDELKQCISDIEFLADPTKGEVRLGRRLVLHSMSLMGLGRVKTL